MRSLLRRFFDIIGPGFITGAADDDPAGIATYTQTGTTLGYQGLWMALFSIPLMITVQEMCARIGIVTGKGLANNIRRSFSRPVVIFLIALLFAANTLNLGADLGMMAAATQLLLPMSFSALVIVFTIVSLILQIFIDYDRYANYLKWLTFSLFAYIAVAFAIQIDWRQALLGTFVPQHFFEPQTLMLVVAVLGTTISPYLFFWQTSQEVEEAWGKHRLSKKITPRLRARIFLRLRKMKLDVNIGMIFSNMVAWFIMLMGAAQLKTAGYTTITSASQAAQALRPLAGNWASLLFVLGTVGTGLLTVPILSASAAYAICELFDFPEGLSKKWYQARAFYGFITLSTLLGLIMNSLGLNPVRALIYSAIANALTAPFFIFAILCITNNPKIMGERYTNSKRSQTWGWITLVCMVLAPVLWGLSAWQGW